MILRSVQHEDIVYIITDRKEVWRLWVPDVLPLIERLTDRQKTKLAAVLPELFLGVE